MSAAARVRVTVAGRVQGVGYRESCRRAAAGRGLSGWVRNLTDGRVEAVFEGARTDVEAMVHWCRRGPLLARVDRLDVADEPAAVALIGFQVR